MTKTIAALYNEPPITIPLTRKLLITFGWERAVFIQQIHYWICNPDSKKRKEIADQHGNIRYWVYNTYQQWKEELFYSSDRTVRRMINFLENEGIILSLPGEGRFKYYTIDYERLETYLNGEQEIDQDKDIYDDCPKRTMTKVDTQTVHNGHPDWPNWTGRLAKVADTYIDTSKEQERNKDIYALTRFESNPSDSSPLPSSFNSIQEKKKKKSSNKATRLPEDWVPTTLDREYAFGIGMSEEMINLEERNFREYWVPKPGKDGLKLNWSMTWNTWCRRSLEFKGIPVNLKPSQSSFPIQAIQTPINQVKVEEKHSDNPYVQKWNELQTHFRDEIGHNNYHSWIAVNLELVKIDDKVVFKVKSNFARDWIIQNYLSNIVSIVAKIKPELADGKKIEFIVPGNSYDESPRHAVSTNSQTFRPQPHNKGMKSIGNIVNDLDIF